MKNKESEVITIFDDTGPSLSELIEEILLDYIKENLLKEINGE